MDIEKILESLSNIFTVFKPRPEIVKEKAEKRRIKNEVRKEKAENKIIKLNARERRLNKRLNKN